LWMV